MAPGQPRYIGRNVDVVLNDIDVHQARHGTYFFNLITEALPPKWAVAFSREVLRRGTNARFWSYLKNETKEVWSQDVLDLMSDAGIRDVTCGVESTSDRVLQVIDKGTSRDMIVDNYQMFARAGIVGGFNLIPDYPTATLEEAADGIDFVKRHIDVIYSVNPQMFDLSIQSAVAGCPEQCGIVLRPDLPSGAIHGTHLIGYSRTIGLSAADRKIVRDAYSDLAVDVARYHVARDSWLLVRSRDCCFEHSRLVLDRSCRAFRSTVSLDGSTKAAVIIGCPAFGAENHEIPADYVRLASLLSSPEAIEFGELVGAYTEDVMAVSGISPLPVDVLSEIRAACEDLVKDVVFNAVGAIVSDVGGMRVSDSMRELARRADMVRENASGRHSAPLTGMSCESGH